MNLEEKNNEISDEKIEIVLLKAVINATISELKDKEFFVMKECSGFMHHQLEYPNIKYVTRFLSEEDKTQFESILKSMEDSTYKEYIRTLIMKVRYYNREVNDIILYPTADDVNDFANEVIFYNKGIDELIKEADNNIYAKYELCMRCLGMNMKETFYNTCVELAEKNHKKAIYQKAYCLINGIGTQLDREKAFEELYKLVEESKYTYTKAIALLGYLYETGFNNGERNEQKAIELYNKVCDIDSMAKYYLGKIYLYSIGIERDEKKGIKLLKESANMGYKDAIRLVTTHLVNKEFIKEKLDLDIECINDILVYFDEYGTEIEKIEISDENDKGEIILSIIEEEKIRNKFIITKNEENKYTALIDMTWLNKCLEEDLNELLNLSGIKEDKELNTENPKIVTAEYEELDEEMKKLDKKFEELFNEKYDKK